MYGLSIAWNLVKVSGLWKNKHITFMSTISALEIIVPGLNKRYYINPQRMHHRVTVVVLCVCVCLSVCPSVCLLHTSCYIPRLYYVENKVLL